MSIGGWGTFPWGSFPWGGVGETLFSNPDLKKIFLAEITAGLDLSNALQDPTYTNCYYVTTDLRITGVKEAGNSFTSKSSISDCNTTPRTYYWDRANEKLYIHTNESDSPYGYGVVGEVKFFFSTEAKIFNDIYYDPRIKTIPQISQRVEKDFLGISQIDGGEITFINNDGFFDSLGSLLWDYGRVTLYFGADTLFAEMSYGSYHKMATWAVSDWEVGTDIFSLTLVEVKKLAEKEFPTDVYDPTVYPGLTDNALGKTIPVCYGTLYDIEPTLIDVEAREFKVAGHRIYEFNDVRVDGVTKNFASTDLVNATFTLSSSDFTGTETVTVDIRGKTDASGNFLDNAADIVKDILTSYLGETSSTIKTSSFDDAKSELTIGTDSQGNTIYKYNLGVYIDSPVKALDVIDNINQLIGARLFINEDGLYNYLIFKPLVSEELYTIEDADIFSWREETNNEIYTSARVGYKKYHQGDFYQFETERRQEVEYMHNLSAPAHKTLETDLADRAGAEALLSRTLYMKGAPQKLYYVTVQHKFLTQMPGDQIRVKYSRYGIDQVFEIIEANKDLDTGKASLVLGDRMGLKDRPGFWVNSTDTLPTRFSSLAGYGSGSLVWNSSWDDDIKAWARQNVGYWTDSAGFADSTDPDSHLPSVWV